MKEQSSEVSAEFDSLDLEDPRLDRRAKLIASRLAEQPELSFPKAFGGGAELEGFYRFLRNVKVNGQRLLAPHAARTMERMAAMEAPTLCVHDTTTFTFDGRANLGIVKGGARGFLAHCSVAFGLDGMPLGTLRVHTWQRDEDKPSPTRLRKQGVPQEALVGMPSEMDRWGEAVSAVEALVGKPGSVIHIADSEGDDYRLLAQLVQGKTRFVVRGAADRRIVDGKHSLIRDRLMVESPVARRSVTLEARPKSSGKRNPARSARQAHLDIRAASVTIMRPTKLPDGAETIELNVVHVLEAAPPDGEPPVEWMLLTSESIETVEAVGAVVDMYRRRWLIEEFFKALKTGCAYEARQLETFDTFDNALALFIPVAWMILRLRAVERKDSNLSVNECLNADQIAVLRAKSRRPILTVSDALAAIAQLGGHLRSNGRPGWLVLWRGFRDLLLLAQGFALARECLTPYSDQS